MFYLFLLDWTNKTIFLFVQDYIMSLAKGSAIPASNTKNGNFSKLIQDHRNKQHKIRNEIKAKAENLACEIVNEYLERKPFRSTNSDLTKFPSNELSQVNKCLCLNISCIYFFSFSLINRLLKKPYELKY